MIQKNKLHVFILLLTLSSCTNSELTNEAEISLIKHNIYLQEAANSDSNLPPSYDMVFQFKNTSKRDLVFISKANKYEKTKSRLYLLDTLQNVIMPIYSGSRNIVSSNNSCKIYASINIRDNGKYFNLKDTFFNKLDYTKDKILLDKILVNMINRSIIIYEQDSSDIQQYKLINKNVKPLQKMIIIKIYKKQLKYIF